MSATFWPIDPMLGPSVVHANDYAMNPVFKLGEKYPGGRTMWTQGHAPDLTVDHSHYTSGRLRACEYCGSLHPSDLAAYLREGAKLDPADRKYGWPHKFYVDGIPNPYKGMENSTMSMSSRNLEEPPVEPGDWIQLRTGYSNHDGKPVFSWFRKGRESDTAHGKFYTIHLQDATPEDRAFIEAKMGLNFDFQSDGRIGWKPYAAPRAVNAVMPSVRLNGDGA